MKPTFTGPINSVISGNRWGTAAFARRTGHGSMPWTSSLEMRQPQDGAQDTQFMVEEMPSPRTRGSLIKMNEPEDAGLTGTTRSLGRRLLGLNVVAKPAIQTVREAILPKRVPCPTAHPQVA